MKTFNTSSARSSASSSTTYNVDQGVKALVGLYLMIDDEYKYPVGKVKSSSDGSYKVTLGDVKDFLTNTTTHAAISTAYGFTMPCALASTGCFQLLGPLRVRAMYTSGSGSDLKARVMTAMADPSIWKENDTSTHVRVDPIVARAAEQIMGTLVTAIKTALDSISFLSTSIKATLMTSILAAVNTVVVEVLTEYKVFLLLILFEV